MFITLTQRVFNQTWATKGPISNFLTYLTSTFAPLLKILLAIFLLWTLSGVHKQRALTAYVTGILGAFVTWSYLQSMFYKDSVDISGNSSFGSSSHDVELSHVALFILAINASFVGAALGSLLPRLMAGVTLGCGVGLLCGAFVPTWMISGFTGSSDGGLSLFTIIGPTLSLVGGILTTR